MHQLIYYPTFEVRHVSWLKFALLYLDQLLPIFPRDADPGISETFRCITNETDLISPHRPNNHECESATFDAIEVVERILRNPKRYSSVFRDSAFVDRWRDPNSRRFVLFRGKFVDPWEEFCMENGLASQSCDGIAISGDLANVYMSILAHVVSESVGIPPITDYREMDQIAVVARRAPRMSLHRARLAQGIVRLSIPYDISEISISKIIELRNKPGFKDRLHAFHAELDSYLSSIEDGTATGDFLSSRGSIVGDFTDEIARSGSQAATVALGIWLVLSKTATTPQYLKEVAAATYFAVSSIIAIRNTWNRTKPKRLTRKYLATIQGL